MLPCPTPGRLQAPCGTRLRPTCVRPGMASVVPCSHGQDNAAARTDKADQLPALAFPARTVCVTGRARVRPGRGGKGGKTMRRAVAIVILVAVASWAGGAADDPALREGFEGKHALW